jgi:hypothetical protein
MSKVKDIEKAIDWQAQLTGDEVGKDGNTEFVYLKGLRRLAKIKGLKNEDHSFGACVVMKNPTTGAEYPFVQMKYTVEFEDGTVYSDVADAHTFNVQGVFSAYPTAMAATRAEARALRKALGIAMVSKEELGADNNAISSMKNEVTPAQIRVIKNLQKTRKVPNAMDLIKECTARDDVFEIKDLTFLEAKAAIKWLNKKKVA